MPEENFRFKLRLRFRHPTMDMDEVTREMGIQPARSWTAGTERRTPAGSMLDGVYVDSYWSSPGYPGIEEEIGGVLQVLIRTLEEHRELLVRLTSTGGSADLTVAIFLGSRSGGPEFDWQDLRRLGDLKVGLSVSVRPNAGYPNRLKHGELRE